MQTAPPNGESTDAVLAHASPPPPPALDPLPSRIQQITLLLILVAGLSAALAGMLFSFEHHELLQHGGFFLMTYAVVMGASWLPPSVLSRRMDRLLDRWVRNSSGGYYGVMALATFAQLELASLLDSIAAFEFAIPQLREFAIQTAIGFSMDSVKNFVWAMAWPWKLMPEHGIWAAAILVALTWGVFRLGRELLPHTMLEAAARNPHAS